MALAKAEGVDGVNWYELYDSTIHHPQEAVPTNPEYHFRPRWCGRGLTLDPYWSAAEAGCGTGVCEGMT
jgi:hypothetical protein